TLRPGVVVGIVAGIDLAAEVASLQVIFRVLGDERDKSAERVGAVQHTSRSADNLDRLEVEGADEVAVAVNDAFDHTGAVHQHHHAVVRDTPDGKAGEIAERIDTRCGLRHGDAGFVTDEILNVANLTFLDRLAVYDSDVLRLLQKRLWSAIGVD